jgi:DNA-binding NarL/FixJ family response regulator
MSRLATQADLAVHHPRSQPATPRRVRLSPREREILSCLAGGCRSSEVATRLGVSPETVRTHVRNAMRKLEAHTRIEAVAIALQEQMITPLRD